MTLTFKQYVTPQLRQYPLPAKQLVTGWTDIYKRIGEYLLDGVPFYIRPINRAEYRHAIDVAAGREHVFEDLLCQKSLLWPQNFDLNSPDLLAGTPTKLARYILELSGFAAGSQEKIFDSWQSAMYTPTERQDLLIMLAFPQLRYDDLDSMTMDEYCHYLAAAAFRVDIQLITSTEADFHPRELVQMLLCGKEELEERLEMHEKGKLQEQQEQQELLAQQSMTQSRRQPYGRV